MYVIESKRSHLGSGVHHHLNFVYVQGQVPQPRQGFVGNKLQTEPPWFDLVLTCGYMGSQPLTDAYSRKTNRKSRQYLQIMRIR